MNAPPTGLPPPSRRWSWPIEVEARTAAASTGAIVRHTFPERLIGPEPADCEVVLGEDYAARVLERVLGADCWWLWWTESSVLARFERRAPGVRRLRHLPESVAEVASAPAWVARGTFRAFGAALLPPGSACRAALLEQGSSSYSEFDPNFWIGVPDQTAWSPRALESWCAAAEPPVRSLEPFVLGARCVCMFHDGELSFAVPEAEAARVVSAVADWAGGHGVALDRRTPEPR